MEETPLQTAITSLRLGDLDRAWQSAQEGLELSRDHRDSKDYWSYQFVRAEVLRLRGRFEDALSHLEAIGSSPGCFPDMQVRQMMHRGYCAGLLGRYDVSAKLLEQAQKTATDAGLRELRCEVLLRQAMVCFLREDYTGSDLIYRLTLSESQKLQDWYIHSAALAGVGKILMIQRYFAEAIPWFQQALSIVEPDGARFAIARLWSELAVCELGLGNSAEALELFRRAERTTLELGAIPNYQVCVANIGNVYFEMGDYPTAISHYQHALKLAYEIKDPVSIKKWTYNIELAFAKLTKQAEEVVKRVDEVHAAAG
jgi:tetratricopeptide (TPR) repeat protein